MEWHMKRLRHRCCVSQSPLELPASLTTLQPGSKRESLLLWRSRLLLLWRENQWRRPPSKR
jgi:hypothetical protein